MGKCCLSKALGGTDIVKLSLPFCMFQLWVSHDTIGFCDATIAWSDMLFLARMIEQATDHM